MYAAWSLKSSHRGFLFSHNSTSFHPFTLSSSRSDFSWTSTRMQKKSYCEEAWKIRRFKITWGEAEVKPARYSMNWAASLTSFWERLSVFRLGTLETNSASSSSLWMRLLLRFKQASWKDEKTSKHTQLDRLLYWHICYIIPASYINEPYDSYLRNVWFNDFNDSLHVCLPIQDDFNVIGLQVCHQVKTDTIT